MAAFSSAPKRRPALIAVVAALAVAFLALAAPPARAATTPVIAFYGAAGTFGTLGSTVPSGQSLSENAVNGWGFASGKAAYLTTVGSDGTVFIANEGELESGGIDQTATTTAVSAYSPSAGSFATIPIATSTGETSVGTASNPMGADLGDVAPLNSGTAVAFDVPIPYYGGMNQATDGEWPSFGILSKGSNGWQVTDQWTADQLYNATTDTTVANRACPLNSLTGLHDCLGMNEMRQFPASHDILVTQYFPASGNHSGQFMVLHVTGPDSSGQYTASIAADAVYPNIPDPECSGHDLTISPRTVRTDPTSALDDERFVVIFDVFHDTTDCPGLPVSAPAVLEEFKYDAATGTITPASAPILAGDIAGGNFLSFSEALVDSSGNLWVTRGQTGSFTGGNLAVYPDVSGTRTLDSNCPDTSWQNLGSFTSTSSNAPTSWGKSCAPYYDILQASQLGAGWGLVQGTAGGTVVMISQRGYLMPVTPSGSGTSMTFAAGEAVDIGRSHLPLPAPPPTGSFALSNRPGAIDSGGLLWFPVQTIGVGSRPPPAEVLDQWLVSVKVSKLLSPSVIALTGTSGQTTTIPADMTTTTGTTQAAGGTAHTGVTSTAFVGPANDPQSPGGFALQASDGFGVPTGNTVSYKISVPSQGSYSLAYRVFMFCNSTGTVTFTTGSTKVTTTLNTTTSGCNIGEDGTISNSTKFTLPSGTQTVTLTATTGGYYLKWFSLTRH